MVRHMLTVDITPCHHRTENATGLDSHPGKSGPDQWTTRWETAGQPRSTGHLYWEPTARISTGNAEAVPSDQKRCLTRVSGACRPVDALPQRSAWPLYQAYSSIMWV